MTETYEFLWQYRDLAEAIVKRLQKRARRLGVSFNATVSPDFTRKVEHEDFDRPIDIITGLHPMIVTLYGEVTFDVETIKLPGWTLLGVLTPMPTEDGSVIIYPTAVPGQQLPADVREWSLRCDKCGTIRRRSETFIVQHENGEIKQVGRNCIADFLGVEPGSFLRYFDFTRELSGIEDEFRSFHGRRDFDSLDTVLAATNVAVRIKGWMSKGRAFEVQGDPTAMWVGLLLNPPVIKRDTPADVVEFLRTAKIEQADRDAAEACRDWWLENTETSDYAQNGQLLARANVVIPKSFGLAVSLLPVWQKRIADEEQRKAEQQGVVNEFCGQIGKREVFEVAVLSVRDFESDFGTKSLVVMKASTGHILKWWATNGAHFLRDTQRGEMVKVKATVKKHEVYNNRRETLLSRVAEV